MTRPSLDRVKFMKLLALTESSSDGEAMTAMRKAASLARASGLSIVEAAGGAHDAGDDEKIEELEEELEYQIDQLHKADEKATAAEKRVTELEQKVQALERDLTAEKRLRAAGAGTTGPWSQTSSTAAPGLLAAACLKSAALSKWERGFCLSLSGRSSASPKQAAVLNKIVAKCQECGGDFTVR